MELSGSSIFRPIQAFKAPADLNIGTVRNRGIELQLGYNNKFGDVDFNVSGNFTTVNNKVLKLSGGTPFGNEFGRVQEGYPLNYLWGYKVGGIFQTQDQIDAWRQSHADVTIGQDLMIHLQDIHISPAICISRICMAVRGMA